VPAIITVSSISVAAWWLLLLLLLVLLQVTDASGARLNFARGRWLDLDGGIIAAPPAVHGAVLAAVQSVRGSKL
jgi:uncharacterized integral membrane protein